jgi:hypothetical protein
MHQHEYLILSRVLIFVSIQHQRPYPSFYFLKKYIIFIHFPYRRGKKFFPGFWGILGFRGVWGILVKMEFIHRIQKSTPLGEIQTSIKKVPHWGNPNKYQKSTPWGKFKKVPKKVPHGGNSKKYQKKYPMGEIQKSTKKSTPWGKFKKVPKKVSKKVPHGGNPNKYQKKYQKKYPMGEIQKRKNSLLPREIKKPNKWTSWNGWIWGTIPVMGILKKV